MSTAGGATIPPEQLKSRYLGTGKCLCVCVRFHELLSSMSVKHVELRVLLAFLS